MKSFVRGVLICIAVTVGLASVQGRDARAECYLMDWDVETRADPHPGQVRQWADARLSVTTAADLEHLRSILAIHALRAAPPPTRDLRFVVDIRRSDGATESYYADTFYLMSGDMQRCRRIDHTSFRTQINRFMHFKPSLGH